MLGPASRDMAAFLLIANRVHVGRSPLRSLRTLESAFPVRSSRALPQSPKCLRQGHRPFTSTAVRSEEVVTNNVETTPELERLKPGPEGATPHQVYSDIAFAFDIDGVLYRGGQPIPGAKRALEKIRSKGIRYLFLTNGGGTPEAAKWTQLMHRLRIDSALDVTPHRLVQSHTPICGWDKASKRSDIVFVVGSHPEQPREILQKYGFKRIVTPHDLLAANAKIYPFEHPVMDKDFIRALPANKRFSVPEDVHTTNISPNALKIDKILITNDPRDWSLSIQMIYDILISHKGYIGTVSKKNGDPSLENNGWQQDGQPEVWISNLDLLWKTDYPVNRFGTGAFVEALKGVWAAATGGAELKFTAMGKPFNVTYSYAHQMLLHYYHDFEQRRIRQKELNARGRAARALSDAKKAKAEAEANSEAKTTGGLENAEEAQEPPTRAATSTSTVTETTTGKTRTTATARRLPRVKRPLRRVYMIGDNPESDIKGANDFHPEDGTEWVPILVRTGVWEPTALEPEPRHRPAVIVDDVADAVVWALRNEGLEDVTREWLLEPVTAAGNATTAATSVDTAGREGESAEVQGDELMYPSIREAKSRGTRRRRGGNQEIGE